MLWCVLISPWSSERGWATVGIIPLLKGRMRGAGMQPLGIIRPSYCETSSRQKSKRKTSLGKVLSIHNSQSYQVVKVLITSLYRNDLLIQCWTTVSSLAEFLNCNTASVFFPSSIQLYAGLKITCLSDGIKPIMRGGGVEAGCKVYKPICHKTICFELICVNFDSCFVSWFRFFSWKIHERNFCFSIRSMWSLCQNCCNMSHLPHRPYMSQQNRR